MKTHTERKEEILKRIKEKAMVKKKRNNRLIALGVCAVMIFAGFGTVIGLFFSNKSKNLTYDYVLGALVKEKVENAQYMPDESVLAGQGSISPMSQKIQTYSGTSSQINVESIDKNGFISIIENMSEFSGESAGKHDGYNIYEIKNEITFILETAPAFNQWFRFGSMREDKGFVSVPYYEYWTYYLESDEEAKNVSITRVSDATRFPYIDLDSNSIIEYYDENEDESIVQYQIMKINYYVDENNDEVIESFIYSVALDHFYHHDRHEDSSLYDEENYYKPVSLQYMKNVKNKSLTKYQIIISGLYDIPEFDDGSNNGTGYDIRGLNPYGIRRNFTQLDYQNEDDIKLLTISQTLPNQNFNNLPATTNIYFYNKNNDLVQAYVSTHDYFDEVNSANQVNLYLETKPIYQYFSSLMNNHVNNSYSNENYTSSNNVTRTKKLLQTDGNEEYLITSLNSTLITMSRSLNLGESSIAQFSQNVGGYRSINLNNHSYEEEIDNLINKNCKEVVDNNILKNHVIEILKSANINVPEIQLKGPFEPEQLLISYLRGYTEVTNNPVGEMYFDADAQNINLSYGGQYSLSPAFVSQDDIIIIASDYYVATPAPETRIQSSGYFNLLNVNNLITKAGTYTLQWVLTQKVNDEEILLMDLKAPIKVLRYQEFKIQNTDNEGVITSYTLDGHERVMKLIVEVTYPTVH